MDIQSVIARRISTRNFEAAAPPSDQLESVRRAGEEAEKLTATEMQFLICSEAQMGRAVKGIIGDYGKTIHAPHYVVAASREREGYLTDAGFRFEQLILDATRRGFGTCWVGLMFKEAELRSVLGLDPSWRMIAISPIGYPLEKSVMNRVLRTLAGSKGRLPIEELFFWRRHGEKLPIHVTQDKRLMQVLEATRWAPSWMNRQPWRFILSDREVFVYKIKQQDREGKDYHRLDCGIAMCHLHLASGELGIQGRWELASFDVPGAPPAAESIGRFKLDIQVPERG